jgi:hypothetical protein
VLALTEAATRLSDRADAVTDEIWDEAAGHYDEQGLAAIILIIATTNLFNASTRPSRSQSARPGVEPTSHVVGSRRLSHGSSAPLPANRVVTAERARTALRPSAAQVLWQECL